MNTQIEKEFKVLITEEQYQLFTKQLYPQIEPIVQKNVYYDTLDCQLSKRKIALRIRYIQDRKIVTIKYFNENDLIEMEKEVFCDYPLIEDFSVRETLKKLNINSDLIPKVSVTTHRTLISGEYADLCIDKNIYDDHSIDFEVEYEVKKQHNELSIFQGILDKVNIKYTTNCPTKLSRAIQKSKDACLD